VTYEHVITSESLTVTGVSVSIHSVGTTRRGEEQAMTEANNIPSQAVPEDSLALRVFIARRERKLSQRAAAELCGLTFGEWQSIEDGRGARQLDVKISKIADGLRYDRDWLMWGGPLRQNIADLMTGFHAEPVAA